MTELVFKGKEFVYNHHLAVPFRPLKLHADKSVGEPSLDGNLIIQGDNLHALKALLPTHAGKVDCVFIDPPYNTGNEGWSYNDNVNSPLIKEWLNSNPIGIEDGLRHDKWCAMMYPRFRLLYELLSDTGSLWMTLDDNETYRARSLLDEVFGNRGFVANCVWQHSVQGKGYTDVFSVSHNHLLVYAKDEFEILGLERRESHNLNYSNPDNDPRGPWRSGDVRNSLDRPNLKYRLQTPSGKYIDPPSKGWRWKKETMQDKIMRGEIVFVDDETRIMRKIYLKNQKRRAAETLWFASEVGSTRDAQSEVAQIMQEFAIETIKPVRLVERILEIAVDENALILDSFAGSGTTAHAVLKKNADDDGNRQFILIECEDYADTLTAERVRRVINGYEFEGTQKEELLREKITWTSFKEGKKRRELLEQIAAIEKMEADRFDKIKREIKDGELTLTGEKKITDRTKGLGGSFTYCTLGAPLELDKLLTGEELPKTKALGAVLFHMATNSPFNGDAIELSDDGVARLGEAADMRVWLIYKPDVEWLKSADAALTLARAREIAASDPEKHHLVFAPARFVSQKMLNDEKLKVEFAPLPYALYRIERA